MNYTSPIEAPFMSTISPLPLNIVRGQGSRLYDEDGKGYLDFWCDEGVNSLGYSNPVVKDALELFMEEYGAFHMPNMYRHEMRRRCAERLVKGAQMDRIFFANSGTEANEAAIKLARLYQHKHGRPGCRTILTMEGNFHGRTGFSLAASDSSDSPYHVIGYGPIPECFGVMKWSELDTGSPYDDMEVAAVICAPILGNNVVDVRPLDKLAHLRDWCHAKGALLIYDEVQVGMGRTGTFCAWHQVGDKAKPDIMTLGKGIGAGLPMAACLAHGEVAETWKPGEHFSTFGGNLLSCAMCHLVLNYLDEPGTFESIIKRGHIVRRNLDDIPWMRQVYGMGLHNGFLPDWNKLGMDGYQLCHEAMRRGLLIVTHRPQGVIRFTPPLAVEEQEIRDAIGILKNITE